MKMKLSMYKNFIIVICRIILLIIFIFGTFSLHAQQSKIDSLKSLISNTKSDTVKIILYGYLAAAYYEEKKIDSCVFACKQGLALSEKNRSPLRQYYGDFNTIAWRLYEMGHYSESLEYASRHLALSEQLNDTFAIGIAHLIFGHDFRELGEYRQSLNHYFKAREYFKLYWVVARNKPEDFIYGFLCIAMTYLKMNNLDSALVYARQGYVAASPVLAERIFGDIYFAKAMMKQHCIFTGNTFRIM